MQSRTGASPSVALQLNTSPLQFRPPWMRHNTPTSRGKTHEEKKHVSGGTVTAKARWMYRDMFSRIQFGGWSPSVLWETPSFYGAFWVVRYAQCTHIHEYLVCEFQRYDGDEC